MTSDISVYIGSIHRVRIKNMPIKSRPKDLLFRYSEGGHFATLIVNSSNIYFYWFAILNYKTERNRKHNGQLLFNM